MSAASQAAALPRARSAAPRVDKVALLVLPAALFLVALFVYPFLYGLWLSFRPAEGGVLGNYAKFFADPFLYETVWTTLRLAVPVTVLNLALAVPIALRVRLMKRQRILTTILVVPITLGTVLVAQGLLNYLGPQGWFNRVLIEFGMIAHPVRLLHNYWGVFLSLLITGLPFTFLLTMSYASGIDPALENAAATLGATAAARFRTVLLPLILPGLAITFCLSFVQAFSVFPSAVLLGAPSGPTRVISIAAYDAAFEQYDYSLASAIAMVMGAVQLGVVAVVLVARSGLYRGASGGKG